MKARVGAGGERRSNGAVLVCSVGRRGAGVLSFVCPPLWGLPTLLAFPSCPTLYPLEHSTFSLEALD